MDCIYCTPEWFEESSRIYRATPRFEGALKKVTTRICYRIAAEPAWGIEKDFVFGVDVTEGVLNDLRFFSEAEAKEKAEFVMAATPQEWKLILRKEHKFLTDFTLGKIKLEQGSKVGVFGLAPYANAFIDALTQVNLKFQDELSPQQLDEYREYASQFRSRLGV
jgi:putative sterol carrier protein